VAKSAERKFELANRLALRPAEAAEVLGICERKLRELLPELPHIRVGNAVLIPTRPLEEWLRREATRTDETHEVVDKLLGSFE